MSINDIIRAWTDASFRKSLEAQGIEVPANPAGTSVLSDADLDSCVGGANKPKARNTQGGSRRGLVRCCWKFDGR